MTFFFTRQSKAMTRSSALRVPDATAEYVSSGETRRKSTALRDRGSGAGGGGPEENGDDRTRTCEGVREGEEDENEDEDEDKEEEDEERKEESLDARKARVQGLSKATEPARTLKLRGEADLRALPPQVTSDSIAPCSKGS